MQLRNPKETRAALKQVLDQFYSLQDQHNALQKSHAELLAKSSEKPSGPPPGSGPTDTQLLGLFVEPVDTNSLANGATLKFNKARGIFSFQ
jgi:hypothetical protein